MSTRFGVTEIRELTTAFTVAMLSFFPNTSVLSATFGSSLPSSKAPPAKRSSYEARTDLYQSWSVTEDAKQKTQQLSDAAVKEFSKAQNTAQSTVGHMELYSGKYYATCV